MLLRPSTTVIGRQSAGRQIFVAFDHVVGLVIEIVGGEAIIFFRYRGGVIPAEAVINGEPWTDLPRVLGENRRRALNEVDSAIAKVAGSGDRGRFLSCCCQTLLVTAQRLVVEIWEASLEDVENLSTHRDTD